ncbi:MAG TPA: 6,7-dimethyl-8-ribityllumazine synthase [Thermohalobaculum sp.]|nr:6,7-dimethyl-8-ribityllumazine synthase [Thermohalobaculum sp.]
MASTQEHATLSVPALSPAPRVLIVAAPFYRTIADGLIAGARAVLDAAGATHELIEVPGALEVPVAIRLAAESGAFEGYVALGCVVRGETTHYETVCNDSSRGLMLLGVERGLAIGNGILTCEDLSQAAVRADPGEMDKGGGAATAALYLIALARRFRGIPGRESAVPGDADILLAAAANQPRTA